jgi:hypothetical protein
VSGEIVLCMFIAAGIVALLAVVVSIARNGGGAFDDY